MTMTVRTTMPRTIEDEDENEYEDDVDVDVDDNLGPN